MAIQVPKLVAETTVPRDPRALIFISNLKTTEGSLFAFTFLRHNPQRCAHLNCMNVLSPSNRFGFCIHHQHWRQKNPTVGVKYPDFNKVFAPQKPKQRVCSVPRCNTVLCQANRSGRCKKHNGKRIARKNHWHGG